ncbi:phosphopantetheine-binding protein [Parvibaculum sp.]|uniref:phosphopantetheine-binding protein n=1 Tax=Parvibaculum sp. TaxID=2024848 RepID=UPI000C984959|nr:phosphopantetheine-binding protein [Parvibaculum sp.]MAB14655.1 acyl carrier protein [Parvibaculum sp.]|tara:strand:+ start:168 stop:443 length:276 start_codon:yes stop_codon:yes gene_type:complete
MDELERRIRHLIVETLNLEDIAAEDIDPEEALFGEGLCLDSIDALEIGVEIQKTFGIKVDPQDENLADYFASVRELARFITRQKGLQEQAI